MFKDPLHGLYTSLGWMRRILRGCRPFKESSHGFYTSLEWMR